MGNLLWLTHYVEDNHEPSLQLKEGATTIEIKFEMRISNLRKQSRT